MEHYVLEMLCLSVETCMALLFQVYRMCFNECIVWSWLITRFYFERCFSSMQWHLGRAHISMSAQSNSQMARVGWWPLTWDIAWRILRGLIMASLNKKTTSDLVWIYEWVYLYECLHCWLQIYSLSWMNAWFLRTAVSTAELVEPVNDI